MSRNHRLLSIALGVCAAMPFEVGAAKPRKGQKVQMGNYSALSNKKPQQQKNQMKIHVGKKQPQVLNKNNRQLRILKNRAGLAMDKRQLREIAVSAPKEEIKVLKNRETLVRTSDGKFTKGKIALVSVGSVVGLALIIGGVYVAIRRIKDEKWPWEKVETEKSKLVLEGNQIKYNYENGQGSATMSFNLNSTFSCNNNKVNNVNNNNGTYPPVNSFNYEYDEYDNTNNNEFEISTETDGMPYNNQNDINNNMPSKSSLKKFNEDIIAQSSPDINKMEGNNLNTGVMPPDDLNVFQDTTSSNNDVTDNLGIGMIDKMDNINEMKNKLNVKLTKSVP